MFYFIEQKIALVFLLFLCLIEGCQPKLIPSTNLKITKENKEIVAFLESYKAAIEKRSVDAVMELVAKDFKDSLGTDDPTKQLNYLTLKERLEKYFPRILDMRLGLFVQHAAKIEKDTYEVVFYFNKNILSEMPSGDKWTSIKEVSRMVIRRVKNPNASHKFEIIQGI